MTDVPASESHVITLDTIMSRSDHNTTHASPYWLVTARAVMRRHVLTGAEASRLTLIEWELSRRGALVD